MPNIGVMLYGFNEEGARSIHRTLERILGEEVKLISGSGKEGRKVREVLEEAGAGEFVERKTRVVMFLGFDDNQIGMSMKEYPGELPRPIFCTLTENNLTWTLGYLIEHLLEEQERFKKA